jgi:plastocyanin
MPARYAKVLSAALLCVTALSPAAIPARAQEAVTIDLSLKNRRFEPAELKVPAGKPIRLRVKNLDETPAEFESVSLRVEKVVAGKSEAIINLRALAPGRYKFVDDFHHETRGSLVAQ